MKQFSPFKQLVEDYSGLEFSGVAEQRLVTEVSKKLEQLGVGLEGYLQQLRDSPAAMTELVNQLTVNETYFYREPEQIHLFVQQLLPRLQRLAPDRPLRILSVGCSSGEEPYTLAMAICERWGRGMLERVQIEAGDLDENILQKARAGIYSQFSFRALDDVLRDKYFKIVSKGYQLDGEIRRAVRFFPLNLKADSYPLPANCYDVVFFRNVSIYFSQETRQSIQLKLKELMSGDSVLVLGSSEILGNDFGIFDLLEEQGQYYFAKGQALLAHAEKAKAERVTLKRPLLRSPEPDWADTLNQDPLHEPAGEQATVEPELAATAQEPLPQVQNDALVRIRELLSDTALHAGALSQLEAIVQAEPDNAVALLMKAWILLNKKDFVGAQALLEKGLGLRPWCLDGLVALGLCQKWQDTPGLALQSFKKACYSHPESWLAHYYLADLLRQLKEFSAAQQSFQVVRRILSHNIQAASGSQWLPLELPAKDVLFLAERSLLGLKKQSAVSEGESRAWR